MSVDLTDIAIIFGGAFIAFLIILAVAIKTAYERGYEVGRVEGEERVGRRHGEEFESELDV